jgi:checkpoint serine/threonine-protein kinase
MDDKERALKRQELRQRVDAAIDNADDPLAEYDHFVKWTIKNYPPGSRDSNLIELLHETTQKFKSDQVYKSDLRYLKLWALYARHVNKPARVYQSLVADNIGTSYALLYEEYANALERENWCAVFLLKLLFTMHTHTQLLVASPTRKRFIP